LPAEVPWLAMIQDRNFIVHTYNERTAEEIRRHVDDAVPALRGAYALLTRMAG
jgi:uncharacterized protein with HEPN domain